MKALLDQQRGIILLAGFLVLLIIGAVVLEAESVVRSAIALILLLIVGLLLQLRRRMSEMRDRLGRGMSQLRMDVGAGSGGRIDRGRTASDPAYRGILGAIEQERFNSEKRYAEFHEELAEIRRLMEHKAS